VEAEASNMIEPVELVEPLVWGAALGALMTLVAGIRRIPWGYAAIVGVGWGVVFAALKAATFGVDTSVLILVGAIGGSLTMFGFERGEQERKRISDEITAIRSAPPV
jgi:precorrin isomerase